MSLSNVSQTKHNLEHVAIVMDGNGRWAKARGLPRIEGHRQGVEALRRILGSLKDLQIKYLTVYAFSSENWQRPKEEVDGLMKLMRWSLKVYVKDLIKHKIRLHLIGRIQELPQDVQKALKKAQAATQSFTERTLIVALNYGSRQEVVDAAQRYAQAVIAGQIPLGSLDWPQFSRYLDTADVPDPDLWIRPSGEYRLSNYLLLQIAYAEMYFTPVLWPDFSPEHLAEAIAEFSRRERRFGKTSEQL